MSRVLGKLITLTREQFWPITALLLCTMLVSPGADAQQNPWGSRGDMAPWYAPPPGYPGPNGQLFPQTRPAPPKAEPVRTPPQLSVAIDGTTAYVHQNLVVTLQLSTDSNVANIATVLPTSDKVLFRDLGDPTAHLSTDDGTRRIINVLRYQLVPLEPGKISLAPLKVKGTYADGTVFEISAARPIQLEVLPPAPNQQPWLPLHDLTLSAQLQEANGIGEGQPIKLEIQQRAVGMVGAQLPSPEAQLKDASLQVYRDGTNFAASVTPDGRLAGSRIDRYTLVPITPGDVVIPQIAVSWWNVDRRRKEQSIIPQRRLATTPNPGDPNAPGQTTTPQRGLPGLLGFDNRWLWGALIVLAFLAGLFWRRIGRKLREIDEQLFRGMVGARLTTARRRALANMADSFEPARAMWHHFVLRWAPRRIYQRLRNFLASRLPRPLRLWFCVRTAQLETNPEDWASVLRFVLEKRLKISGQKPMGVLAKQLAELHPGSDRETLDRLMRQLEGAVFGRLPIDDFESWKSEFMRQIQPHPWTWIRRRRGSGKAGQLPALNPEES